MMSLSEVPGGGRTVVPGAGSLVVRAAQQCGCTHAPDGMLRNGENLAKHMLYVLHHTKKTPKRRNLASFLRPMKGAQAVTRGPAAVWEPGRPHRHRCGPGRCTSQALPSKPP